MARTNSVLAIDIGGCSLKLAEFSFNEHGGMELLDYEFLEYPISDSDSDFLRDFSEAMRTSLTGGKFTSKQVRLSLSGQNFFTRLSNLPPVTETRSQMEQIVEFEAKQTVPYPMNEVVWDYQLIRHAAVGDDGSGMGDEMEALFVAVKEDLLTSISDIVEDYGKEIISIEVSPTSFFNAARANGIGTDQCDVILNIGGRCANLVFLDKGRIFTRTIPIAGQAITQQIAKEFNINFEDAEELKRRHCFVALGGAYEEPDSQVAATISKIARNVMTRLHGEVNRSINVWRSQHGGNRPARMLLCGGSSIIPYAPHFFNEKLRIPVEYLNVFQVVSLSDRIDRDRLLTDAPLFPDMVGLGLRHVISCPVEISLLPSSVRFQQAFKPKRMYLYICIVLIFMCLMVIYAVAGVRQDYERSRVAAVKNQVESTKKDAETVTALDRDLKSSVAALGRINELIEMRGKWLELMDKLEEIRPKENVWFTSILPVGADTVEAAFYEDSGMGGGMFGGGMPGGPGAGMSGSMPGGPGAGMSGGGMSGVSGGAMSGGTMPGGMPGLGGDMFGGSDSYEEPTTIPGEYEMLAETDYIEVIGHWSYIDKENDRTLEIIRDNIKNSDTFELEDSKHFKFSIGSEDTNVSEFRILLHLKEPINL